MYKQIFKVMATFKELKNQSKNTTESLSLETSTDNQDEDLIFELEEARYMLNVIANNDFKGRDVQIVYNIALKLQDIIKNKNN